MDININAAARHLTGRPGLSHNLLAFVSDRTHWVGGREAGREGGMSVG